MKNNRHDHDRLPDALQRAFEAYPRITASDDFNQRVLERILAGDAPTRFELFCDRMDEMFARPVLKLVGAASLGSAIGLAGIAMILLSGGASTPATPQATVEAPIVVRQMDDTAFIGDRMAWAHSPSSWMSYELWDEKRRAPKQPENGKAHKTGERSSACLVCVSSV